MTAAKWTVAIIGSIILAILFGSSLSALSHLNISINPKHENESTTNQVKTELTNEKRTISTSNNTPIQNSSNITQNLVQNSTSANQSTQTGQNLTPPQSQIMASNLVSYWRFDYSSAGQDAFGKVNNDGDVSGPTFYVDGKVGRAINFYGNTYIQIHNFQELNSPSFSTTFWVNPNQLRVQGIMDKIAAAWTSGWRIFMDDTAGNINFDASREVANITTPPLAVGKWSFVAVTFDSDSKTAKIYLDGVLSNVASGVDMQNIAPNDLVIASSEDNRLNGKLDDLRFYNVALTEQRIKEIYDQSNK